MLLARRKRVEAWYFDYLRSFEGIKDPYIAPDVDEVHWFLYVVHLGTRFSRSSRDAIVDDLRTEQIESAAYRQPLHLQRRYFEMGYRRGDFFVTEKVADRALALPFHAASDGRAGRLHRRHHEGRLDQRRRGNRHLLIEPQQEPTGA